MVGTLQRLQQPQPQQLPPPRQQLPPLQPPPVCTVSADVHISPSATWPWSEVHGQIGQVVWSHIGHIGHLIEIQTRWLVQECPLKCCACFKEPPVPRHSAMHGQLTTYVVVFDGISGYSLFTLARKGRENNIVCSLCRKSTTPKLHL